MSDFEQLSGSHEEKMSFDYTEFGMEPELSEQDEAVVAMAEEDLKLFLAEWGLSVVERHYNSGELEIDKFRQYQDSFFRDIENRRRSLGLPGRPNYPSS